MQDVAVISLTHADAIAYLDSNSPWHHACLPCPFNKCVAGCRRQQLEGATTVKISVLHAVTLGIGLSLATVVPASASSISFSDTFDPIDVLMSGQASTACSGTNGVIDSIVPGDPCESLTWTHTLAGFNGATDTLSSASAVITVYNDASDGPERFDIVLDLLHPPSGTVTDGSTVGSPLTFTYNVVSQLADGSLAVTLTSQNGNHDFFFAKSELTAAGTRTDVSPVPEPASIGLVGLGFVAIARRRFRPPHLSFEDYGRAASGM
jgi:hypothetical protein